MNPINTQPPEPQRKDPNTVDLINIFRTIQGEGPYNGSPAIFVRLAGCSILCSLCDTQYTIGRKEHNICKLSERILSELKENLMDLVVFTGGEPFRQAGLAKLVMMIANKGINCQIETNGTLFFGVHPTAVIVCSPKTGSINKDLQTVMLMSKRHCFKYVLDADHVNNEDGLPTSVLGMPMAPARPLPNFPKSRIYLQPADVGDEAKNKRNLDAVVTSCFKHGYRLCLQMHKIAGLP